jgi:hypothetical protein
MRLLIEYMILTYIFKNVCDNYIYLRHINLIYWLEKKKKINTT